MHASLLYQLTGDAEPVEVESQLGEGFPAIDAERLSYLDGQTLQHGTAAARVETETRVPQVKENKIITVTDEVTQRVKTEWYLDLDAGWVGVDTGDGEFFLEILERKAGVVAEELEIGLDVWIEDFVQKSSAGCWGVNYSEEEGDLPVRAGSGFHQDASIDGLRQDADHISGIGFRYQWGDRWVKGSLFESGYVALFEGVSAEFYGRWLSDQILPYAAYNADFLESNQSRFTGNSESGQSATAESE